MVISSSLSYGCLLRAQKSPRIPSMQGRCFFNAVPPWFACMGSLWAGSFAGGDFCVKSPLPRPPENRLGIGGLLSRNYSSRSSASAQSAFPETRFPCRSGFPGQSPSRAHPKTGWGKLRTFEQEFLSQQRIHAICFPGNAVSLQKRLSRPKSFPHPPENRLGIGELLNRNSSRSGASARSAFPETRSLCKSNYPRNAIPYRSG